VDVDQTYYSSWSVQEFARDAVEAFGEFLDTLAVADSEAEHWFRPRFELARDAL
jgi:hypothetical protein